MSQVIQKEILWQIIEIGDPLAVKKARQLIKKGIPVPPAVAQGAKSFDPNNFYNPDGSHKTMRVPPDSYYFTP